MSTSSKVGELFQAAGQALSQLGELTMQLHPSSEPIPVNAKWTDAEIDMLMVTVKRFCTDLNNISEIIKTKTITQIRTQMKRKAFEEAGLSLPSTVDAKTPVQVQTVVVTASMSQSAGIASNELTLSALNTTDHDPEFDGLSSPVLIHHVIPSRSSKKMKLELDTTDESINVV